MVNCINYIYRIIEKEKRGEKGQEGFKGGSTTFLLALADAHWTLTSPCRRGGD